MEPLKATQFKNTFYLLLGGMGIAMLVFAFEMLTFELQTAAAKRLKSSKDVN